MVCRWLKREKQNRKMNPLRMFTTQMAWSARESLIREKERESKRERGRWAREGRWRAKNWRSAGFTDAVVRKTVKVQINAAPEAWAHCPWERNIKKRRAYYTEMCMKINNKLKKFFKSELSAVGFFRWQLPCTDFFMKYFTGHWFVQNEIKSSLKGFI